MVDNSEGALAMETEGSVLTSWAILSTVICKLRLLISVQLAEDNCMR